MHCGGLTENIYLLTLYVYPFCYLKYYVKQHVKDREKFHVIYYLIFVKNKSEFVLVLYPKFNMNAQEKRS